MNAMSGIAARSRAIPLPRLRRLTVDGRLPALACLALLTAWAVHARTRDLRAPLWIDEGISFGIAHHHLSAIPGVLRQDGSPPLFYLMLHVWTGVFGGTPRWGHALTLLLAVLAVPAAYWAASLPFGRAAGLCAAAIVALDPFAGTYAIEVRMYSLLLLLGVLTTGTFVRAFIVRPGHRGWAAAFAVSLAALFYTHNWALFLGAAAGVAWLALLAFTPPPERRALLVSGLIGFGGAALLFLPWVPTVLAQMAHTGAPWSHAPHLHSVSSAFERMLGGHTSKTVLVLFALTGGITMVRARTPVVSRAALATLAIALGTLALAYAWSNISSPAWALRYLSIVLAPTAIVLGAGLARNGVVAAVVLAVLFMGSWYGKPTHASLRHKSNVEYVTSKLGPGLAAGTQVFATQPEQVPVLRYYLQAGLRYVTPLGRVPDPRVMDWRDAMRRLDGNAARWTFARVLAGLRPGQQLLLVQPRFGRATAPWTKRIQHLARVVTRTMHADHSIRVVARVIPHRGYNRATLSAFVLERKGGAYGGASP
jgi:hypothetical protein